MKSLVIKYKSKKNGKIVTKWGILDPQNPGKILRSYDKKEDADKSAKVTNVGKATDTRSMHTGSYNNIMKKPINEKMGEGKTTWNAKEWKPNFEYLAERAAEAAEEWLDDDDYDDANAKELGHYIADFIVEHQDTVLKEFGKAVIFEILNNWYTGDDDDVQELSDSVDDYIDDELA